MLQRPHEVRVVGLGLLVALGPAGRLVLEAQPLLVGVVQCGEGCGELDVDGLAHEELDKHGIGEGLR